MSATAGSDSLSGTSGADTINLLGGDDSYLGLAGADSILGADGADTLDGGEGNDSLIGGTGSDSIDGGAGIDILSYAANTSSQAVSVNLATGNASDGLGGSDTLAGIEFVIGGSGNDTFSDGTGNETFLGGSGDDVYFGGIGNDSVYDISGVNVISYQFNTSVQAVSINLDNGRALDGTGGSDSFSSAQHAVGGGGNDTILGYFGGSSLAGGEGNDSLLNTGTAANDTIAGDSGDDTISGGGGNDVIINGSGNDCINGGTDVFGGRGSDLISFIANASDQAVSVNLSTGRASDGLGGTDTLISIENIAGGQGNDTFLGGSGNESFWGNNGDDSLRSLNGNNSLLGGNGHDTIIGASGADLFFGEAGNDSIDGGTGTDTISFASSSITQGVSIDLQAGRATDGFGGTDTLASIEFVDGSDWNDTIIGSAGAETISGSLGSDQLIGDAGNDSFSGGSGNNLIDGGAGNDSISYGTGVSVNLTLQRASHGGGTDTLTGLEYVRGLSGLGDTMIGASGSETLHASGSASLLGEAGNDSLVGDFLDTIGGGSGDDTIFTNTGADLIFGDSGNDSIDGGAFNDVLSFLSNTSTQAVSVNLATGRASDGFGGSDTLAGIEFVWGGSGNDTIIGGNANDSFLGSAGDDSLLSNAGDDSFSGDAGNDTLDGGNGLDFLSFSSNVASQAVSVNLFTGQAADGLGGTDSVAGIEYVVGGNGNDTIIGGANAETFLGGSGNDSLFGDAANDTLLGDAGDDTVSGGNGIDSIAGGSGNDCLLGDASGDTIHGNDGNDTILGGSGSDRIEGGNGSDSIDAGTGTSDIVQYNHANAQAITGIVSAVGGSTGYNYAEITSASQGNDTIINFELLGGSGNNDAFTINSAATGNAYFYVFGSDGNDTISVINGDRFVLADYYPIGTLTRGVSVDLASGRATDQFGTDSLIGVRGLRGSYLRDTMLGTDFDDYFRPHEGSDSLDGRSGNDMLDYSLNTSTQAISANLAIGRVLDGLGGTDTVANIEYVYGGAGNDSFNGSNGVEFLSGGTGNDSLVGNGGDDTLSGSVGADTNLGGDGNDRITGGSGNDSLQGDLGDDSIFGDDDADTINGGADNDTLHGANGDDRLEGGTGNDFASYTGATAAVEVRLTGGGTGNASGGLGADVLLGIEGLIGTDHNDTLIGDDGANTVLAGNGVDSLSGGAGNDWLDFGDGDENFLRGLSESGSDTLIGGDGTDTLDLGLNWSYMTLDGAYSLYQDEGETIYAQGWETVVCFAEGTRIVTTNGEDAVENLRAGDMVLAMRDGQAGFEPLRWVGFMDVAVPRNAAMAAKTAPVLIKAGALAPNMPARDLRVSPDHAMEIAGHLIPAKHLVNGVSIIQEIWCRRVRYFHLELEAHGLLLSEGTWSESYLDDGNRHAFNNAAMTGLFLDFEAGRSKGQYDHQACLPVLRQGLKLDEIHGRIAIRALDLARAANGQRRA